MTLDSVPITPGTGADIATDTVGGLQVQVIKPAFGGDGVATMVSATDPLPVTGTVTITDGSGPVTVDGTVAVSGTVDIEAASLPLPAGAATQATLASIAAAVRAEDTTHASGDVGIMTLAVRADGETTLAIPDGDYAPLQVNAVGRLKVSTQPVSGTVTAGAGTARIGFVADAGIWYDDTATALAANATFTGTSRDATVTATATAIANAGAYAEEVRALAESDVSGTLWLEVSRDNTNWRRVRSVATAAITGGGQAAEIIYRPSVRYWRIGYTNGATVQARLMVNTIAKA